MSLKVYKSSAGSGKTFTLVLEYLGLVIQNPTNYRNILAVTFTNKAANEMKVRIIRALWLLSSNSTSESTYRELLINKLISEYGYTKALIQANAAEAFSGVLHSYSDFNVSTIDSFIYGLVRNFTRELGLPSHFEIELDDDQMANLINHEIITRIGLDSPLTDALITWVLTKMDDDEHWGIESDIRSFIKELLKERSFLVKRSNELLTTDDFADIRRILNSSIADFESQISEIGHQLLDLLKSVSIQPEQLSGKSKGIGPVIRKLAEAEIAKAFDSKVLHNVFEGSVALIPKNAAPDLVKAFQTIEHGFNDLIGQLKKQHESSYKIYRFHLLIRPSLYLFSLNESIRGIISETALEQQLVHISEFNKRIADLLAFAAVPYIYERIGDRFHHYLIDEFQDTSILQWHNFLPLIENSLSQGYSNLIVGDGKQAIYRFRGGEVGQFIALPKIFGDSKSDSLHSIESVLERNTTFFNLEINYRSDATIVDFNNRFFSYLLQYIPESFQKVYEKHKQDSQSKDDLGLVQIEFLEKADESDADQLVLDSLVSRIEDVLNDGYSFYQIAILVQTNQRANFIAQALSNLSFPVVSSDSLLLSSSEKVKLIISYLRFYIQPWDAVNRLELIDYLISLQLVEVNESNREHQLLKLSALSELEIVSYIQRIAGITSETLDGLGCYEMVVTLIHHFNLNSPTDPYLIFLLQEIYRFEQRPKSSIGAFLIHWNERLGKSSLAVPESIDALRIMTIHKAKGLEFPVVIYPFADAYLNDSRVRNEWVDFGPYAIGKLESGLMRLKRDFLQTPFDLVYFKDQENRKLDLVNLLYVVLTRAAERLYILVKPGNEKIAFSVPNFLKGFLEFRGEWQADRHIYSFGNAKEQEPKSIGSQNHQVNMESGYIQPDWTNRMEIKLPDTDFIGLGDKGPTAKGILLHDILSEIDTIGDFDRILSQYNSLGLINKVEIDQINAIKIALEEYPVIRSCFSAAVKSRTEAVILSERGDLLRVDRISRLKDRIVVIDYKTGMSSDEHYKQLEVYKTEIESIEQKPVEAYLMYLQDPVYIVRV